MAWFWTSSPPAEAPKEERREGHSADACPVDHKTRQTWLEQARSQQQRRQPSSAAPSALSGEGCDSSRLGQSTTFVHPPLPTSLSGPRLGTDRAVSTIPRASSEDASAIAANSEKQSGKDASGMWIYPSERMFFDAMKRKNYDPQAEDMRAIVPIHNAVNERAWKEICEWEKGRGSEKCGGPKLYSFSGTGTQNMTPKARINSLLGYTAPFDRHDWVVDRCGEKIDYVIDFYSGRDEGKPGKSLNFYLDVRPKLNTWEGWRMRVSKMVGL